MSLPRNALAVALLVVIPRSAESSDLVARSPIVDAIEAGDDRRAQALLGELRTSDPGLYRSHGWDYLAGILAHRRGDLVGARQAFERYLDQGSEAALVDRATVGLARSLKSRDPGAALECVVGFAGRFPASGVRDEARLIELEVCERLGRQKTARKLYRTLPKRLRRAALGRLFEAARETGRTERAGDLAEQILNDRTNDQHALSAAYFLRETNGAGASIAERMKRGRAFYAQRDFAPAIAEFTAVSREAATSSQRQEAGFLLGRAAMKAGDDGLARHAFEIVAGGDDSLADRALYQLARVALDCADEPEALARLRDLADTARRDRGFAAEGMVKLVRTHAAGGRLDEAERVLGEIVGLSGLRSKASARAAVEIASVAVALGQPARASKVLEGREARDRELRRDLDYWRGAAAVALGERAVAVNALRGVADGRDLLAGLARQRLSSVADDYRDEVAELVRRSGAALDSGDPEQARRLAEDALDLGATGSDALAARGLRCASYRALPGYREVYELEHVDAESVAVAGRHADAALQLYAMGLYAEAADELRAASGKGNSVRRLHEVASLAARGGDYTTALVYADRAWRSLPKGFEPSCLPDALFSLLYPAAYGDQLDEISAVAKVDPSLVRSVMREESRYDPTALSAAGARGLMQFIPETARRIGHDYGIEVVGPQSLHEPRIAIRLGAHYLAELVELFGGREGPAVAAYNAGEETVYRWLQGTAGGDLDAFLTSIEYDETRAYVDRVLSSLAAYRSR